MHQHIRDSRHYPPDSQPRISEATSGPSPRIVAIGGGTGLPAVLGGLADALDGPDRSPEGLTGVVTVTDDGGSSGQLRRETGMLPPGDVRNCLVALAHADSPLKQLLQHRFVAAPSLKGHALGNLLLAALVERTGDFCAAIHELGTMMGLRGRVLPATIEHVSLVGEFHAGHTIEGETAIVADGRPLRRVRLDRTARALPEALNAIVSADVIVVGPGSLYTSILPNLLIDGIAEALARTPAIRIFVGNLMTEPGETDGFSLDRHLDVICEHTHMELFDAVLVNAQPPSAAAIARYASQSATPTRVSRPGATSIGGAHLIWRDLAWETHRGKIRHSPPAIARAVLDIAAEHRRTSTCPEPNFDAVRSGTAC